MESLSPSEPLSVDDASEIKQNSSAPRSSDELKADTSGHDVEKNDAKGGGSGSRSSQRRDKRTNSNKDKSINQKKRQREQLSMLAAQSYFGSNNK